MMLRQLRHGNLRRCLAAVDVFACYWHECCCNSGLRFVYVVAWQQLQLLHPIRALLEAESNAERLSEGPRLPSSIQSEEDNLAVI
jgi:hypothetical protein